MNPCEHSIAGRKKQNESKDREWYKYIDNGVRFGTEKTKVSNEMGLAHKGC